MDTGRITSNLTCANLFAIQNAKTEIAQGQTNVSKYFINPYIIFYLYVIQLKVKYNIKINKILFIENKKKTIKCQIIQNRFCVRNTFYIL